MKKLFLSIIFISTSILIHAQVKKCYTHELIQQNEIKFPGYQKAINQTFEDAKKMAKSSFKYGEDSVYRVPVVIHILYRNDTENIDDSLIYNQIAVLNNDFRRHNADTSLTRQEFYDVAADAGIEFYLAEIDPDGNPTDGILRVPSTAASFIEIDILSFSYDMDVAKQSAKGGDDAWSTNKYLNIWVCDLSVPILGDALLGFAYPPLGMNNWPVGSNAPDTSLEGVVIHYKVFGRNNPNASGILSGADGGRTTTHEVGHYLGLRHIWGDGGCSEDDGVDDTPLADSDANFTCDYTKNTCTDSPVDFPDMIENFMDYADDACMNMLTKGQVEIMRSVLENNRAGLLESQFNPNGITNLQNLKNNVLVYPNPANYSITVNFSDEQLSNSTYTISSSLGLIVEQGILNDNSKKILLSNLSSGLYYLNISKKKSVGQLTFPLIVND